MCGIAGYIGFNELEPNRIQQTKERMVNRGPDARAHSIHTSPSGARVYLLHSRLSIIDLDPRSNQPYQFEHLHLIFNGEVYNYLEVRKTLAQAGYSFRTDSDTEVLIKAYHFWGDDFLKQLEGMWSLAIYDERADKLILARDRFAEKPLYYLKTADGVFFASEVKFLKSLSGQSLAINHSQLYRYMVNGYKSLYKHGDTFYADVDEVDFASIMEIGQDLKLNSRRYWNPEANINESLSMEEAIEGVRERLLNSVKLRLRADVPLAFCLSGGIDSASLASIAAKEFNYNVHSFSIIDKDERYNEQGNIQATIDDIGCDHTLIHLEPVNMLERLENLIAYHDGPVATISYLVHSMLSEQIAGHGYKVAISGTAADELLTGYYDHFNLQLYTLMGKPELAGRMRDFEKYTLPIVRNPHLQNPKLYFDNPGFRDHIYLNQTTFESILTKDFHEGFVETHYADNLLQNRMMNELFHEGSRVILHEDDLNSMLYSIENRSPFLDTDLFEFSYTIPTKHLINDGYGKYVLREAVKGYLNDQVRLDRRKKGFNASINSIVDFNNPTDRSRLLDDSPVFDLVDKSKMENLFNQGDFLNSHSKFIFYFMNVKTFLEQNV